MKLQIVKSIIIQKSAGEIYQVISDLNRWIEWSPWYRCEPTSKTTVTGQPRTLGQKLHWSGEIIGSGEMTLQSFESAKSVTFKLAFLTPWKSVAEVIFTLTELEANKTEVSWLMNSSLPFFMFFFKNAMAAYIGGDFERGLRMLKELSETGQVLSRSVYQGEKQFDQFYVLGRKTASSISEISKFIHEDFENLDQHLKSGKISQPDFVTTLSHVHDIPKGHCVFTAGYAYTSKEKLKVPQGLQVFEIDQHKGMLVDHYGTFQNIGNPWAMVVAYQRGLKKKISKKAPAYEIYRNMPGSCADKDIHTQIVVPLR